VRPLDDRPIATAELPRPLTSFVGREREVAAVIDRLRDEQIRLLTLTGPGGVGKTRLAIRAAAEAIDKFPDGIWFVALAPVRDPALVPATIAHAFEIRESAMRSPEEAVREFLRDRRALLVLDNFEHLLDAAPLVADLLAACAALTVLVTSRGVLHVSGEHTFAVPPMSLPGSEGGDLSLEGCDGVRLFVERARAAHDDFDLTQENGAEIAEVCRRLDGLPLAIELAAARVTHLPPRALLDRLGRRLPLLTGGPRDQPARLQTMRQAIAWSYDLLAPAERLLFRRLAVFVVGCTLEAAERVSGGEFQVSETEPVIHRQSSDTRHPSPVTLDLIASLTDKSLLRAQDGLAGAPRFTMLETVREFALEHLAASGEGDLVRGRHAAWCLELAEESEFATPGGPEQARWLDRLDAELPNLRGALGWLEESGDTEAMMRLAGALGGFWFWRSRRVEGAAWAERALAAADSTPTVGRAKALRALAFQGMEQGSLHAAGYAAESVEVWTALGDARQAANARLALGQILEYRADYARAIPLLEESAAEWDALGDPARAAIALFFLGQAALDHQDGARADALFEEAMDRFRRGGIAWGIPTSLHQLGEVAAMRGDTTAAAAYYAESLAGSGARENLVGKLVATARLAAVDGQSEAAARLFGAAAALADSIGYVRRRPEQERLEGDAAVARAALGDAGFEAIWVTGRALRDEQAVAEALAVLAIVGGPTAPTITADSAFGLTPREREVLTLMCEHLPDREIAERLFLSTRTVEGHVSHIIGKLGARSRREAVAVATRPTPI
jgi:non-specific serine/threonine protein kinase